MATAGMPADVARVTSARRALRVRFVASTTVSRRLASRRSRAAMEGLERGAGLTV